MEACTVAQIVVRIGTPPGIPGLQTVWRSAGIVLTTAWAGPARAKRSRPSPVAAARTLNARLARYGSLRMSYLGGSTLWFPGRPATPPRLIGYAAAVTCTFGGAAEKSAFPAWLKCTVPAAVWAVMLTVAEPGAPPTAEHAPVAVMATDRPEDAVAATEKLDPKAAVSGADVVTAMLCAAVRTAVACVFCRAAR